MVGIGAPFSMAALLSPPASPPKPSEGSALVLSPPPALMHPGHPLDALYRSADAGALPPARRLSVGRHGGWVGLEVKVFIF